ncbi:MAG TPA: OmpW family outer membrane protein [Thermoanaerobaculia bacterium]|nr:OmpW family outer membrane protein [Thermoanaerobaculia bacterium]
MKRNLFLLSLLLVVLAHPAAAADRSFDITANAVWVDSNSSGTFNSPAPNQPFDINFDGKLGYGAAVNVFFGNTISLELAGSSVNQGVSFPGRPRPSGSSQSNLKMIPLTAVLQWHFIPSGRIDPYIGAGAAYVLFDNIDNPRDLGTDVQRIKFKDDVGLAVNAGIGIGLTDRFGITVDGKYVPLKSSADAIFFTGPDSETRVKINPVIFSAGLTFKF